MFKVEENLILTKNAVLQDSFVVEDCGKYYEELSGFYVCLPKNRMDAIKQYMGTLNNSKEHVDKAVVLALVRERYTILQKAVKVKYGFPMDNLSEKQLKCFSFWDFNRFLTQRGVTSSADLLKLFLTKVYGSTINDREISEVLKI